MLEQITDLKEEFNVKKCLPVTNALPSQLHFPANTAPRCASTVFSTRPVFEMNKNFPKHGTGCFVKNKIEIFRQIKLKNLRSLLFPSMTPKVFQCDKQLFCGKFITFIPSVDVNAYISEGTCFFPPILFGNQCKSVAYVSRGSFSTYMGQK